MDGRPPVRAFAWQDEGFRSTPASSSRPNPSAGHAPQLHEGAAFRSPRVPAWLGRDFPSRRRSWGCPFAVLVPIRGWPQDARFAVPANTRHGTVFGATPFGVAGPTCRSPRRVRPGRFRREIASAWATPRARLSPSRGGSRACARSLMFTHLSDRRPRTGEVRLLGFNPAPGAPGAPGLLRVATRSRSTLLPWVFSSLRFAVRLAACHRALRLTTSVGRHGLRPSCHDDGDDIGRNW